MTSSQAKSGIFSSIRENLAKSKPFDESYQESESVSHAAEAPAANDLLELFRENLELVGGKYTFVENENEAADRLRAIVSDLAAKDVMVSDSELVHRIVNAAGIDAIAEASR